MHLNIINYIVSSPKMQGYPPGKTSQYPTANSMDFANAKKQYNNTLPEYFSKASKRVWSSCPNRSLKYVPDFLDAAAVKRFPTLDGKDRPGEKNG